MRLWISKNLYIKESDKEVMDKMEELLEKQGKSVSEFVAEAPRNFVALNEKTGDIELVGKRRKRIFKGTRLYWETDTHWEEGVFLTARGAYVYWWRSNDEKFRTYDSLEELRDDNLEAFDDERCPGKWEQIEDAEAELNGQTIVEELDI